MAITKTTTVKTAEVMFLTSEEKSEAVIQVRLLDTWDDPDDAELPIQKMRKFNIKPGDDVSAHPQFVQDLVAWLQG
jgi:hypothetical protein